MTLDLLEPLSSHPLCRLRPPRRQAHSIDGEGICERKERRKMYELRRGGRLLSNGMGEIPQGTEGSSVRIANKYVVRSLVACTEADAKCQTPFFISGMWNCNRPSRSPFLPIMLPLRFLDPSFLSLCAQECEAGSTRVKEIERRWDLPSFSISA